MSVLDADFALTPWAEPSPMTLAMGGSHDPGEFAFFPRGGGPMTLAMGWSHDLGEFGLKWSLVGGD